MALPALFNGINYNTAREFYEAHTLLEALGKVRGDRIEEAEPQYLPHVKSMASLRRGFLRDLAYLCDYGNAAQTTTAIALEERGNHITYWLASNTTIPGKGKNQIDHLHELLELLRDYQPALEWYRGGFENHLWDICAKFSSCKIKKYSTKLIRSISMIMADPSQPPSLIAWLQRLSDAAKSPWIITKFCFQNRDSKEYRLVQGLTHGSSTHSEEFVEIDHLFGRLNHTMKAIKTICRASRMLPQLLPHDIVVKRVPSSEPQTSPLLPLTKGQKCLEHLAERVLGNTTHYEQLLRLDQNKNGIYSDNLTRVINQNVKL